jgi:hypothetical protein
LDISSNVINRPSGDACLYLNTSDLSATSYTTIYNNTFLNDGTYNNIFELNYGIAAGGFLIAKNNIFGTSATDGVYYWRWVGTIAGTFTCDYNLYWNSNANYFYLGGSARDWAYWTGTGGYDTNSPNTTGSLDPTLVGAGTYTVPADFALLTGSPAINAGTDAGVTLDFYGNPRVGATDIGAIEKQ